MVSRLRRPPFDRPAFTNRDLHLLLNVGDFLQNLPCVFADAHDRPAARPIRPVAERHHELIKFAIVGATTSVIDSVIFYTLKLTISEPSRSPRR